MKKKIINGLLLVAAIVVATSTFVSCKDYDGDNYAELREQIAAQNASQENLRNYLQQQLDALQRQIDEGKCDCPDLTDLLAWYAKWKTYNPTDFLSNATAQAMISNFIPDTWIEQWITNHKEEITNIFPGSTITYNDLKKLLDDNHYVINDTDLKNWLTQNGYTTGGGGTTTITYEMIKKLLDENGYVGKLDETALQAWLIKNGYATKSTTIEELKTWIQQQGYLTSIDYDALKTWLDNNGYGSSPVIDYDTLKKWLDDNGYGKGIDYDALKTWLDTNGYGCKCTEEFTDNQKTAIEKMIEDWVLENVKLGNEEITNQINQIINNYITDNKYMTQEQIEQIVNNLLKDYYTKTEVANLLNNYITNDYLTQNFYTKDEVVNLINTATQGALTEDDVKRIISENVVFTPYVKKDDLAGLIQSYLKENNLPQEVVDWLNGGQITHPAFPSLEDYVKSSTLEDYVKLEGIDDLIKKYLDEHPSSGSCSCDLSEYAKKEDVYTKSEVYTKQEVTDLIKDYVTMTEVTTEIEKQLGDLKNLILNGDADGNNSLINAYMWADYAYKWVKANEGKEWLDKATFETFENNYNEAKKNWDKAWELVQEHDSKLTTLDGKVTTMEGDITTLQDLYDGLNDAVEQLQEDVEQLQQDLDKAEKLLKGLTSDVKKLITDIHINGTYNPFFGYFSASALGIQSNVLAVLYGKNTNGEFDFPTYENDFYFDSESVLSAEELRAIRTLGGAPEETIVDGKFMIKNTDDNAGHIYLTVNPSNVDFSSTVFDLSRSNGTSFPVTLSPIEPCYETLGFGYTRANSANGFYKAKAKISYSAARGMVPYQLSDLKDWASLLKKTVKDNVTGNRITLNHIDITSLANMAYQAVHNINADRLGVRAQWTNSEGDKVQVVSQYDIAAIGLHPMNFGTLEEHVIPVIDRKWKLINGKSISKRFLKILKEVIDIDNLQISEVHIERAMSDKYDLIELAMPREKFFNHYGKVTVLIDGVPTDVYTKKENVDGFNQDEDLWYQIVKDDEEKGYVYINVSPLADMIYDDLNEGLEPFNESVGDFNAAIDNLPKAVTGIINRYVNKANRFIEKIHAYVDRANLYVQPALFARTSKNWTRLSTLPYRPSSLTAGTTLRMVPTTWTLEILVPCFMKHVAVSNVYASIDDLVEAAKDVATTGTAIQSAIDGDAQCQAIMKTLNEQIGSSQVLQDLKPALEMTPDASMKGKVIEIAYTAVDYDGRLSGDKYYVIVK